VHFFCCGSAAAPRAEALALRPCSCDAQRLSTTAWYLRDAAGNGRATRPRTSDDHRFNGLGNTVKYLRRTTSGAAENGLGTTIKYLRGVAGNGLGTTTKYFLKVSNFFMPNLEVKSFRAL
jgi:hypothetical protein